LSGDESHGRIREKKSQQTHIKHNIMQNDELRKRNYSSAGALTSNKGKMLWLNLFCVDGLQKVSPWEKMALF